MEWRREPVYIEGELWQAEGPASAQAREAEDTGEPRGPVGMAPMWLEWSWSGRRRRGREEIPRAACADLQDQLAAERIPDLYSVWGREPWMGGGGSELQLIRAAVWKTGRGTKWRQGAQLGSGCKKSRRKMVMAGLLGGHGVGGWSDPRPSFHSCGSEKRPSHPGWQTQRGL